MAGQITRRVLYHNKKQISPPTVIFRMFEGAMIMSITRTTHRTVTFFHPFHLSGYDGLFSAGEYEVDTLEKLDSSAATRSYIKLESELHLWADDDRARWGDSIKIIPRDLEAALALDSDPLREDERNQMIKSCGNTPTDSAA
tara:strand:+ start:100 stop:525 length:426 start_codon:yes stop_codon:yes gene_type:complete